MANDPTLPLRQAVIAALRADASLIAKVPADRVYGMRSPATLTWPFTRYGPPDTLPFRATSLDGAAIGFAIHSFSKAQFEDECANINAALSAALDGKTLGLDGIGGAKAHISWAGSQIIPDAAEADAYHGIVRFEARIVAPALLVNVIAPRIYGSGLVGQELTLIPGLWLNADSISWQWRANGVAIPGATAITFTPLEQHEGVMIDVVETATNARGSASVETADIGPVLVIRALDYRFNLGIYHINGVPRGAPFDTFTRTGEQGAVDSDGTVDWFAANVPAINGKGYHAYGALTNNVLHSQAFDNAAWVKSGVSAAAPIVTADAAIAPDGTATADRVVFGDTSTANSRSTLDCNSGASLLLTGANTLDIWARGDVGGESIVVFSTPDGVTFQYLDVILTTAWQRIVMPLTNVDYVAVGHDRRTGQAAKAQETVYLWQAQVLAGNFPDGGPIIRTTTAAASLTASAGSVLIPNGNYTATHTFDDNTTQQIPVTVTGGSYSHPVFGTLNRGVVKRTVLVAA